MKTQKLKPSSLAISASTITATATLFSTILTTMAPSLKTITPFLQNLYGPFGYSISLIGAFIGTIYVAIDTFILTYAFAWVYNKLL